MLIAALFAIVKNEDNLSVCGRWKDKENIICICMYMCRDDQSQMWSLQEIHEKFLKIKFLVLYSREKVNDFRDLEVTDDLTKGHDGWENKANVE